MLMTNELPPTNPATEPSTNVTFAARLKSTREAMGLDRKTIAGQLRLNEKIIIMMEKDRYPADLPVTFIRGYLRAYAKLLQIPEHEIKKALEPIKPKPAVQELLTPKSQPVTFSNYYMQLFTYLIVFTLISMVGMWWYTHSAPAMTMADSQPAAEQQPSETTTQPAVIAVEPPKIALNKTNNEANLLVNNTNTATSAKNNNTVIEKVKTEKIVPETDAKDNETTDTITDNPDNTD